MPVSPLSRVLRVVAVIVTVLSTLAFLTVIVIVGPRLIRGASRTPSPGQGADAFVDAEDVERLGRLCADGRCVSPTPHLGLVTCLDTSGSVPRAFVNDGRALVARRVTDAVTGSTAGLTIDVRVLHAASYHPLTGVLRGEIPPIGPEPAPPVLPANPYAGKARTEAQRAYAAEVAAWLAAHDRATAAARAIAEEIRTKELPKTKRGSDIRGCLLRAQEALAAFPDRELIVVSDLKPQERQSTGALKLDGVRVVVAYWCKDSAAACAERRSEFTQEVSGGGAASVRFLDPIELRSMT